jgi:nitroreductase
MRGNIVMNEVINLIKARKSTRVFTDKLILEEERNMILEAALEAPTAGGMMLYSILEVSNSILKEKLSRECDNQPFIAKAPMVLIFLADYQRWYDSFVYEECEPRKPGEGDILLASADAIIAAQNTVIAAESLGIGSCYIGDILENCETIRNLLNLPDYVLPAAMLVYGYPAESQKNRKKPERFEKKYIVHENTYHCLTKEEQEEMHRLHNAKSGLPEKETKVLVQAIYKRKYMTAFSIEMNRSAGEYLKKFRE